MKEFVNAPSEKKQPKTNKGDGINQRRHQVQCTICQSPNRQEIEEAWINWHPPYYFREKFGVSRDALYRHMHAFDLFKSRRENISMALEKIIENIDNALITGSNIISAIQLLLKLHSTGTSKEQAESAKSKELFMRMTQEERETFARDGSLPNWMLDTKAATPLDIPEGEVDENKGCTHEKAATVSSPRPEDSSVGLTASGAVDAGPAVTSQERTPGGVETEGLGPSAAPAERLWTPAVEPLASPATSTDSSASGVVENDQPESSAANGEPLDAVAVLEGGSPPCPPPTTEGD